MGDDPPWAEALGGIGALEAVADPGSSSLYGVVFGVQCAIVDPGANALGLATTNGLAATLRW